MCNFLRTISIIFLPVYFHIVDIIGKTQYNEHIIKFEFVGILILLNFRGENDG